MLKEVFTLPEDFTKFPGPLKGKGKKKDVSMWLKPQNRGFGAADEGTQL